MSSSSWYMRWGGSYFHTGAEFHNTGKMKENETPSATDGQTLGGFHLGGSRVVSFFQSC